MYTLRKSVQWLADEPHVREECGPYVTRPGRTSSPFLLYNTANRWADRNGYPRLAQTFTSLLTAEARHHSAGMDARI